MVQNETKNRSQTKTKLWIDVMIFSAFLIAMEPRASGITVHEWLATSLIAVLVVHLLLSWDWIANITGRFIGKINNSSRINYILNWLLFIDGTVLILSSFLISQSLMPFLGIELPQGFAWRRLHDVSANSFLVLLGCTLHCTGTGSWIRSTAISSDRLENYTHIFHKRISLHESSRTNFDHSFCFRSRHGCHVYNR